MFIFKDRIEREKSLIPVTDHACKQSTLRKYVTLQYHVLPHCIVSTGCLLMSIFNYEKIKHPLPGGNDLASSLVCQYILTLAAKLPLITVPTLRNNYYDGVLVLCTNLTLVPVYQYTL